MVDSATTPSGSTSPENPSRRQWRFTWETFPHIPTLRLYLFHQDVDPSALFRNLSASLRLQQSLLLVSWVDEAGDVVLLRVPVPKVVIDPSCPVDCRAMDDHVEIKLVLVLPVDHPVVANLRGVLHMHKGELDEDEDGLLNRLLPLSLDSDTKTLSAGGIHFFCKTCSVKLTKQPLRRFVEMPSVNWREVADNWFGGCCCSFGGASEKIARQYVNKYDCSAGTCLLDGASVIVCQDDLVGYTFQDLLPGYYEHQNNNGLVSYDTRTDLVKGSTAEDLVEKSTDNGGVGKMCMNLAIEPPIEKSSDLLSFPMLPSAGFNKNVLNGMESGVKGIPNLGRSSFDNMLKSEGANYLKPNLDHCHVSSEKPVTQPSGRFSLKGDCNICDDIFSCPSHHASGGSIYDVSNIPHKTQETVTSLGLQGRQKWLHNSSLGGGFLVRTSNFAQDIEWVELLCKNCSSLIGCYPSSDSAKVPLDGGIRLFKCYISTATPIGGPCDIFRNHSLQRVFVNLLLESAEDELSYRIIVRDLKSKSPLLLLVFLSSKSWSATGYCLENVSMESLCPADLQPVLKVLFSDCSISSEANSRIIEDWSTKNHSEEIYMMNHLVEELIIHLKSALHRLPPSCSFLQGLSLSSLERCFRNLPKLSEDDVDTDVLQALFNQWEKGKVRLSR